MDRSTAIAEMVNRFLCWPLPKDFCPDGGVKFERKVGTLEGERDRADMGPGWWPIGTNLFTADQAKAMFEHALAGTHPAPAAEPQGIPTDSQKAAQDDAYVQGREDERKAQAAAEPQSVAPADWEAAYAAFRSGPAFPPDTNALKVAFAAGMAYAAKPAPRELSDDAIWKAFGKTCDDSMVRLRDVLPFARAVIAAHEAKRAS